MDKQMTISLISDELRQAATPKKELLDRMDKIIPWSRWIELVLPYYYKGERGNKPYPLERMLRIYVIQNLYNLADMAAKNEILDSRAFSGFCGVDSSNQVPDGDTIGRFRNILKANSLQDELFEDVVRLLESEGLILHRGTRVPLIFLLPPQFLFGIISVKGARDGAVKWDGRTVPLSQMIRRGYGWKTRSSASAY